LAKRKKKKAKAKSGKDGGRSKRDLSPVMKALMGSAKDKYGGKYMGETADARLYGVPIPCLAFMWCVKANILPLSKMVGLAGFSQSQKSSLAFEIARWVCNVHGGYTHLVDNEGGKYNASLIRSIVGDQTFDKRFLISEVEHATEAQQELITTAQALRENKKRDELWIAILDSMAGTEVKEDSDKIDKEGFAGRTHPATANSWTRFLKRITTKINTFPILFLSVNHLKEKPNQMPGLPATKTTPGGKAQRFHSILYFWIKRIGASQRETWEIDGKTVVRPTKIRTIEIMLEKSSMGDDKRKFNVDFCWYDGLDGQQHTFFDWDGATGRWLYQMQSERGIYKPDPDGEATYARLGEVLPVKCSSNRYTCTKLGLEDVPDHALGRAVHRDAELMAQLMTFFAIKQCATWNGALPIPEVEPPDEPGEEPNGADPALGYDELEEGAMDVG